MVDECERGAPGEGTNNCGGEAPSALQSTQPRTPASKESAAAPRERGTATQINATRPAIGGRGKADCGCGKADRGLGAATGATPTELDQLLQTPFLRRTGR